MTRSRGARRGRRGYSASRHPLWIRQALANPTPVADGTTIRFDLIPDAQLDPGARIGSTVVRTFLTLTFIYDSVVNQVNPGAFKIYAGVMVHPHSETASPAQQPDWDWMWWQQINPMSEALGALPATGQVWQRHLPLVDIRAKRVMYDQMDKPFLEIQPAGGGLSSIYVASSVLIKQS